MRANGHHGHHYGHHLSRVRKKGPGEDTRREQHGDTQVGEKEGEGEGDAPVSQGEGYNTTNCLPVIHEVRGEMQNSPTAYTGACGC